MNVCFDTVILFRIPSLLDENLIILQISIVVSKVSDSTLQPFIIS